MRLDVHAGANGMRMRGILIVGLAILAVQGATAAQQPDKGRAPFADRIEILPLKDVRIATFDREGPDRWRLSLGGADWSGYWDWQMAIRVRSSDKTPGRFRVELQTGAGPGEPRVAYRVELGPDAMAQMRRRGFADILVPVRQGEGRDTFRHIVELAVVSEDDGVTGTHATADAAQLPVHSLRLVPPPNTETGPAAEILDDLAGRAFSWFEAYRNPASGLVPDRAPNWRCAGGPGDARRIPCSIASVGYYLSILPDAVKTGRLSEAQAAQRAVTALRFLETHAEHHAGFLHHFLDMETGRTVWNSEFSVLDSSILFNGCMVASVAFGGDVAEVADRLLNRVDWSALLAPKEKGRPELLAMAWEPQRGVYGPMDVRSSEFAMACFLAIGAPAQGVDPKIWRNMAVRQGTVQGLTILNPTHGLFTSYYGLGWHMLRGQRDQDGVDLWANARAAALANRAFCRAAKADSYRSEWGSWWGISAGDSPDGYIAPGLVGSDAGGTVWPTTALAAWPWAPQEIEQDLEAWARSPLWDDVLGPYGLSPFNIQKQWIGTDLIGIDLGSFSLGVANHRRGTVWNLWKQHPIAQQAIARIYPGSAAHQP
jgi:hypothetical protein